MPLLKRSTLLRNPPMLRNMMELLELLVITSTLMMERVLWGGRLEQRIERRRLMGSLGECSSRRIRIRIIRLRHLAARHLKWG